MANIRKSFNFREGVKVDDSVLVVAGTRVGIGTTVPIKDFDVRGDVGVTGLTTTNTLQVIGTSTFLGSVGIGTTNITGAASTLNTAIINTGIVTANSYYGDGSTLSNLPTSPFSSATFGKYVLSSNIGIGSTNPVYDLQVGNDPESGKGVGIDSTTGNIKTSGIITATSFVGNVSGLTGIVTAVGGGTTISLDTDIPISFSSGKLKIYSTSPDGVIQQTSSSGEIQIKLYSTSDISTELLQIRGTASGSGTIPGLSAEFKPQAGVELSYAGTKRFETTGAGVTISGVCTATSFVGDLTGTASVASVALALSQGAAYSADNIIGGIGSFGSVGLGITNPSTDIQIVNSDNAVITLGRATSATGNNGAIGFGKTSASFPYSNANSLDILNYGIGNINFYLEAGTPGISTGDFHWHRRGNYSRLMTLTNGGKLGIGITQPIDTLHVVGTSTVTNKAYFGNDVQVVGDVTAQSIDVQTLSISQLTGNLIGNVNASSGLSTFTNAKVTTSLGINATAVAGFKVNSGYSSFNVDTSGNVGVKTDSSNFIGIDALECSTIVGSVGVGTTSLRSAVDFSDAGQNGLIGMTTTNRYMIPPSITSTERSAIASVQDGALIYNETNDRLEVYPNSTVGWVGISTGSSGGGASALNDLSDVNAGSPTDNQALSWDSSTSKWIPQTVVTDDSRTTKAGTTGSIAKDASVDLNITGFKSYALLKVAIDAPAWVVLYTNDTTRTADDSRAEGTDPSPGSGVIAEVLTTTAGASTFVMSPGVIGWNDDGSPSTTIYAKVKNKRSTAGSNTITVTLTVLKLES